MPQSAILHHIHPLWTFDSVDRLSPSHGIFAISLTVQRLAVSGRLCWHVPGSPGEVKCALIQVLGPIRAWRDGEELDLGPPGR